MSEKQIRWTLVIIFLSSITIGILFLPKVFGQTIDELLDELDSQLHNFTLKVIPPEDIEKQKEYGLDMMKNSTKVCGLIQYKSEQYYYQFNPTWCHDV